MLSLIECYKTIHGINGLDPTNYFEFAGNYRPLRANHWFKSKKVSEKLNSFRYSFLVRVIQPWNDFQKVVAETEHLEIFKRRLRSYLGLNSKIYYFFIHIILLIVSLNFYSLKIINIGITSLSPIHTYVSVLFQV